MKRVLLSLLLAASLPLPAIAYENKEYDEFMEQQKQQQMEERIKKIENEQDQQKWKESERIYLEAIEYH